MILFDIDLSINILDIIHKNGKINKPAIHIEKVLTPNSSVSNCSM